ncbi:hypothetical protein DQ04_01931110 [Trypanosoma grayi]|uniref:hypothetical protein n=1 Tax=Trypanosoma grayi TaxID=71804 RepID=UPI0004F4BA21|nr:hypothetical protein DQ04_01931110 [Trypanosoma grayi]KEG12175.1 hypothetical protein DQ04_01931110 [Trypanosoma grayi]
MSKVPTQSTTKKWMSQRALARAEDSSNRKATVTAQPPPPAPHEHSSPPPPPSSSSVQLPPSLVFERQEAVDALSNLYHNTENVNTIETGPAVLEQRDVSKFHEGFMEALKAAGYA